MATPAIYPFTGDGSRTVFPIPTKILGTEYVKIFLSGTAVLDQTLYDIINNSIVFKTAPTLSAPIVVWVASSIEEVAGLGYTSNIDIVADNIADITLVASGINDIATVASEAQLKAWIAEAEAMTSASYATQVEDTVVYEYGSNGDGTFNALATTDYSAYHWSQKASTFNPALYALLTGATFTGAVSGTSATFTGQVKGITPVDIEDLTRKDYVDAGLNLKAPLDSPTFTGTLEAPTITQSGETVLADTAKSITANGYQKLSNGLIIQWGNAVAQTITFPIAFPTACLSITASSKLVQPLVANYSGFHITPTTTGATITGSGTSAPVGAYYIAIGY